MKLSKVLDLLKAKGEYGHVIVMQGVIGDWPLTAEELQYKLQEIDENEPVELRISSPGGHPFVGVQMYKMLKQHKGTVTTVVEDYAMSAATLPMAAGDTRIIDEVLGQVMIHNATDEPWGISFSEQDHRTMAEVLKRINEQMRDIYVEEFGQDEATIQQWMEETKFFNAQEAVDAGVCTDIEKVNRVTEPSEDDVRLAAHYKETKLKSNGRTKSPAKTEKPKQTTSAMNEWMKKLRAAFGLGDDSDEADVFLSAKELKAKHDTLKAENETLESDLDEVKKERDQFKKELDELKKDSEESEEEELETTLTAMVDKFQIKASQKDELAEEYKGDLAGLKKLQARIPENAHKPGGAGATVQAKSKGLARRPASNSKVTEKVESDHGNS